MPLFTDRPLRSTAGVAAALTVAYVISSMTSSMQAFHLTQTSVAILAISSLLFLVTMHHRREGHLLTQSQEEMVLIGGFGLFFMAAMLAWRGSQTRSIAPGAAGEIGLSAASGSSRRDPGFTSGARPYPCSPDDVYCVVEEWTFWAVALGLSLLQYIGAKIPLHLSGPKAQGLEQLNRARIFRRDFLGRYAYADAAIAYVILGRVHTGGRILSAPLRSLLPCQQ
ncbi:hypothetical protein AB1N83_006769 [Pleurotus pulmonarius]